MDADGWLWMMLRGVCWGVFWVCSGCVCVFGDVSGLFWICVGRVLGVFWGCFGAAFGDLLGEMSYLVRVALGSFVLVQSLQKPRYNARARVEVLGLNLLSAMSRERRLGVLCCMRVVA